MGERAKTARSKGTPTSSSKKKSNSSKKNVSASKNENVSGREALDLAAVLPLPDVPNVPDSECLERGIYRRALHLERNGNTCKEEEAKKRRSVGKVVIPKAEQKYSLYEPLAQLWLDYVRNSIGNGSRRDLCERIVRMDLHGARVEVVRSRDPGLVGVCGIIVAETANTILVVTKEDRVLTVPKNIAVIRFVVGKKIVELSLPAIMFRASERSARKLKKNAKSKVV